MSITDTFSRSWDIAKKTFSVINKDKEILAFPILSSVFSVILFAFMVVPFLMTFTVQAAGYDNAGSVMFYIVMFVFYLSISFIATFFSVATVYCAKRRFSGEDPKFMDGIKAAFSRIHLIFLWSIVSATAGLIIQAIEDAARKQKNAILKVVMGMIAGIVGMAWSVVVIFVVPAMVFENIGPFEALKRSVSTIKKTWGESLIRHYGLGMAQLAVTLIGILVLGIPGILLLFSVPALGAAFLGLLVIYLVVISLVFTTANQVYNTALYIYASTGKVPGVYSADTIKGAFVSDKKR